jgi:hypothetical protein
MAEKKMDRRAQGFSGSDEELALTNWMDEIRADLAEPKPNPDHEPHILRDAGFGGQDITYECERSMPGCGTPCPDDEDAPYFTGGATIREDRVAERNEP